MLHLSSARADARLLACVLTFAAVASTTAQAQVAAEGSGALSAGPARTTLSDALLRAALAKADFSALSLAGASPIAPRFTSPASSPSSTAPRPLRTAAVAPDSRELDCMAQAVYFESRGEPVAGQAAVAQVVLNRVRHRLFPKSVCGVVFQKAGRSCQFSWACRSPGRPSNAGQWAQARSVAARALAGEVVAGVGFATHFNGARAGGFGSGLQRVAHIGQHAFYTFRGEKGGSAMFGAPVRIALTQPAPRTVQANLLPLPSRAETSRMLASASSAVQTVADAATSVARTLVDQVSPGANPEAMAEAAPQPSTAVEHTAVSDPKLVASVG